MKKQSLPVKKRKYDKYTMRYHDLLNESVLSGLVGKLPQQVISKAEQLYMKAIEQPLLPGDTAVIDGYWIETHTIGCRNQGDDLEDEWWNCHYEFYDKYSNDGLSIVAGDPSDGVFVTITSQNQAGFDH